tara:strand:+ start:103 stop:789 length:687 start_codon:yes stop_codon:yes gene_type:complete
MNILCTICARKGSKGIKGKNLLKIKNKSLIFYTIDQAQKIKSINDIVISTDLKLSPKELKKRRLKVFFKREKKLSNDKVGKVPVIRDALKRAEKYYNKQYEIIIDLDVTSPLRSLNDIKNAISKFINSKSNNLITLCESRKNPYFNMVEIIKKVPNLVINSRKTIRRRQDAPKIYDMNASIYLWKRKFLMKSDNLFSKKTMYYLMPVNRSIDIDNINDFKLVKFYLKK